MLGMLSWEHMMHEGMHRLSSVADAADFSQKDFQNPIYAHSRTHITELHHPDLSQLTDTTVGSL